MPSHTCVGMKWVPVNMWEGLHVFSNILKTFLSALQPVCPTAVSGTDGGFKQQVRELQTKQGRCQLGSGCFKHQCLAVGYKVILNGFITDSLCHSAFSGTWSYLIHTFLQHIHWPICGIYVDLPLISLIFLFIFFSNIQFFKLLLFSKWWKSALCNSFLLLFSFLFS